MAEKDYRSYSYWLESCGDDLTPRAPLDGSIDVDVAILGGGFSGLWTAYYLLTREPSLRVAVLERDICGFGASGRNGGWCTGGFPLGIRALAERFDRQAARAVQLAMYDTVDEVGRFARAEGVDIDYGKGGSLRLARGRHQLPGLEEQWRAFREFDVADGVEYLDAAQAAERVKVTDVVAALYSPHTATIHPGKLARGLARAVERRGGQIFEQTEVSDYTTGAYPVLHTARGHARARTIVLAGEAYLSRLRSLRRQVMPVYSLITLTEPLTPGQWEEIGWESRECIGSGKLTVDYLSKTIDGRILFGGRGAPYHFGSRIEDAYDRHEPTHAMLQDNLRAWFPMLRDVRFTHSWGGPLGWPRDFVPTIGYDPAEGLATAHGYTGTGVATANLAGRILADLIARRDSELTRLPIVNQRSRSWEPEPLRFLGVRYVQRELVRIDARAEQTGVAPTGRSLAERLTSH